MRVESRRPGWPGVGLVAMVAAAAWAPDGARGDGMDGRVTLDGLFRRALEESADIRLDRAGPMRAELGLRAARGIFEPRLAAAANRAEYTSVANQYDPDYRATGSLVLKATDNEVADFRISVTQRLPFGGDFSLNSTYSISESSSLREVNKFGEYLYPLQEIHSGRLFVEWRQPLLQGFGTDAALADIRIARIGSESADLEWRQALAQRLAAIERAYLDLWAAWEELKQGAPLSGAWDGAAAARTGGAKGRMSGGAGSENPKRRMEALTRQLVRATQGRDGWISETAPCPILAPAPPPAREIPVAPDREELEEWVGAMPEFRKAEAQLRQSEIRYAKACNQALPNVALFGKYGYLGYNGDTEAMFEEVAAGDRSEWTIGLRLDVPLGGGVSEDARRDEARIEVETARERLEILRFDLRERLLAALEEVAAAGRSLEMANGADAGADGEAGRVRATVRLHRALAELDLMRGAYLERRGITVGAARSAAVAAAGERREARVTSN